MTQDTKTPKETPEQAEEAEKRRKHEEACLELRKLDLLGWTFNLVAVVGLLFGQDALMIGCFFGVALCVLCSMYYKEKRKKYRR